MTHSERDAPAAGSGRHAARAAIAEIPAWDNHNHAGIGDGGLSTNDGTLRGFFSQWSGAYIEARIPQAEFRRYRHGLATRDTVTVQAIKERFRIDRLIDESIAMLQFTAMGSAIRAGCEALYGEYDDAARLDELMRAARTNPPNFLWDRACEIGNIRRANAITFGINRAHYRDGLYKWVPFLDPVLYPFPVTDLSRRGAIGHEFHLGFSLVLRMYLNRYGIGDLPTDFGDYRDAVGQIVDAMIASDGAIGFKIVSMYVRGLDFGPAGEGDAARVFANMKRGDLTERKTFEDYLFRWICLRLASTTPRPIHFHVATTHAEPGTTLRMMDLGGLEEGIFQDTELSNLPFIITHAGATYPGVRPVAACLFHYGNVYTDCSAWSYYEYSGGVDAIVALTEAAPAHKVLWGTDGTAPEIFAGSAITTRRMLADALQRRVDSGSLAAKLLVPLAERLLYQNAEKLYGMPIDG